jgi:DNA topoisomerase-1
MERRLDDVEEGRQSWTEFLRSFYGDFKVTMEKAEAEMNRVQKPVEELEEPCPECGRPLVIRTGRFGRFISCSGFPECRYGRTIVTKTGAFCPQCGGDLVERKTKQKKRIFYGCSNYPTCNFAIWEQPVPELCPNCHGLMVIPRVGADPVCYQEVILPQRSASSEDRPQQDGARARRTSRASRSGTSTSTTAKTAKRPTRAKATATRRTPSSRTKTAAASRKKTATPRRRKAAKE